ncbi:eukaryotic translation elongation factor 1 epsilon-1 [Bombyx mandarina]|uniref:Eukaryotic translation elongation factor 1 epsilon-1 n=1 Tax=Bombyx mandarina TaxID=7092 RepID=A0A6J2JM95_BOMMA|nr:eukaryotic translation elongation factor 1 epsilon-1 [Bombyx mandarina]
MPKMSTNNVDVIKMIGKYLDVSVGAVCYNTDKVPTAVLENKNVEGFVTIILSMVSKCGTASSEEQRLLTYQWLEYISMFSNQAVANSTFAFKFLQEINRALQCNTYLTGQFLTIADVALYYIVYPLLEHMSVAERDAFVHLCRWSKHIQAQPRVCNNRPPLPLNAVSLSVLAPAVH